MFNNKIAIIGLGYIGLPLALAFAKKFRVIGYDTDKERIYQLSRNKDKNKEFSISQISKFKRNLRFSSNSKDILDCNIYIVTVPTPIKKNNKPDLSYLNTASKTIGKYLKGGNYVIYESTVYPGVTEEYCVPILEKFSKLKCKKNKTIVQSKQKYFYVGYSPERINPGDKKHKLENIDKIIASSTLSSQKYLAKVYSSVLNSRVHQVSSIKIAEAAKVIENTQRDINIAFINELSIIFNKMNIDTREVLKAASTKWNFLKFQPGLVGGHCISVDPYYLTYKSNELGYDPKLILAGRKLNNLIPNYINKEIELIIKKKLLIKNAKILIMGLTFKENCSDLRNTKVIKIFDQLKRKHHVDIYDPYAENKEVMKLFKKQKITKLKKNFYDLVVVTVGHNNFRKTGVKNIRKLIKNNNKNIIDIKGIFKKNETLFRL